MKKSTRELFHERRKAFAFIQDYYAQNGEMPSVAAVKSARTLTEDEIAQLTADTEVSNLVIESEDREPSVLPDGSVIAGMGVMGKKFGVVSDVDFSPKGE